MRRWGKELYSCPEVETRYFLQMVSVRLLILYWEDESITIILLNLTAFLVHLGLLCSFYYCHLIIALAMPSMDHPTGISLASFL